MADPQDGQKTESAAGPSQAGSKLEQRLQESTMPSA
jgi:hypothetical protein